MTPKPVLLAVDDDPEVLRAVRRDLRRRFSKSYRVLEAPSGAEALATLTTLHDRAEAVALLLVDQRMPGMSGIELLERAIELHPDARRVMLTAYADTDVAIAAINKVRLHHYILKPWHPPEEHLYPVLEDLLSDWTASFTEPYEGPSIVGLRWSADSHRIRDFLARNQVPFRWLDLATNEEARRLVGNDSEAKLPVVVLADGTHVERPGNVELARALGLLQPLDTPYFDLAIVGAGPAGLAAAVYGASEGLSTALIEREAPGGQAGQSSWIENYLGFPSGLSGADLSRRALTQAKRFGVRLVCPTTADSVTVSNGYRVLHLEDGTEISCRALIVATGASYRRLEVPGAARLEGLGVYYGGTSVEAQQCSRQDVFIVGGANSAGQAALYFAQYAQAVHLVVRSDSLGKGMSRYLVSQIEETPRVVVHAKSEVVEVLGENHLESVSVRDNDSGQIEVREASSLFAYIGATPNTDWLDGVVERDARGFIITGPDLRTFGGWKLQRDPFLLETSVPGVFAVGDARADAVRRVASAVGAGSIAVQLIHRYLAIA